MEPFEPPWIPPVTCKLVQYTSLTPHPQVNYTSHTTLLPNGVLTVTLDCTRGDDMTIKGGLSNLTCIWLPSTCGDGLGHAGALVGSSDDKTCHIYNYLTYHKVTNTPVRSSNYPYKLFSHLSSSYPQQET